MSDTPQARRASGLAITPLAALVLGFFLPTLRACGTMERPASYAIRHPGTMPWLVTPYIAAALLAITTTVLVIRSTTPTRAAIRVAWAAFGLCLVGASATLVGWLAESHGNPMLIGWSTVMVCVALVAVQRAERSEGWGRWIRILFADTVLIAGNTLWMMVVTAMGDGAWDAIGIGGHIYFAVPLVLGLICAYGMSAGPAKTP
jgi:hypothetical protein